jgi:hypothetical protein
MARWGSALRVWIRSYSCTTFGRCCTKPSDRSVRPNMHTVLSVNESGVDPQALCRLLDTSPNRVGLAQFVRDLPEINNH